MQGAGSRFSHNFYRERIVRYRQMILQLFRILIDDDMNAFRIVFFKNADQAVDQHFAVQGHHWFWQWKTFLCQTGTFTCCNYCVVHSFVRSFRLMPASLISIAMPGTWFPGRSPDPGSRQMPWILIPSAMPWVELCKPFRLDCR